MSHRGRRREHGRVRKSVEVLISGLFGVAVVAVVFALLQGGGHGAVGPAQPDSPYATSGPASAPASAGAVQNAAAATDTPIPPVAPSRLSPAPDPGTAQPATEAQAAATTKPATPTTPAAPSPSATTANSGPTGSASPSPSPSPSASQSSNSSSGSGGLLGGLVGGVLGLL